MNLNGYMRKNRLVLKMLGFLAPVALLPLAFAAFALLKHYGAVKKQSVSDNKMIVSMLAEQFEQYFRQLDSVVQQASQNDVLATENIFLKREMFANLTMLHGDIEKVFLVDQDKIVSLVEPFDPMLEGKPFATSMLQIPNPEEPAKLIHGDSGMPEFLVAKRVGSEGHEHLLVAKLRLKNWFEKTIEHLYAKNLALALVAAGDEKSPLIIGKINDEGHALDDLPTILAQSQYAFELAGESYDAVYHSLKGLPIRMIVMQPRDAILARPQKVLLTYLVCMLALLVMIVFVVTKMVRQTATVDAELQLVEALQRAIVSNESTMSKKSKFAYHYEPSAHMGGDWFYIFEDSNQNYLYALIGDITGHGLAQGLVSTAMNGALRMVEQLIKTSSQDFQPRARDLVQLVDRTIRSLSPSGEITSTCLVIQFDLNKNQMNICNAGHTFPILLKSDGQMNVTSHLSKKQQNMLGLPNEISPEFAEATYSIDTGDFVLLYTDGLTEARDAKGGSFGRSLLRMLRNDRSFFDPQSLKGEVVKHLQKHTGSAVQEDDICFLVVQPTPGADDKPREGEKVS